MATGVKIWPGWYVEANVIRYWVIKLNITPRLFPTHINNPVDHSDRIGYVHSTAHSNETGNKGKMKNPIKLIDTANGYNSFGRRLNMKKSADAQAPITKIFNILW